MKRFLNLFILLISLSVSVSCSKDVESAGDGGVVVQFFAGDAALTKAANPFATEQPLKIYVFKRGNESVQDFNTVPYKIVTGKTGTTPDAVTGLSPIILNGGDLADGYLTIDDNCTYDFVLAVNEPDGATFGSGGLAEITHGYDLMTGRADGVAVAEAQTSIDITFRQGGVDSDGNLPHLCSRIDIMATAETELIEQLSGSLKLGISSAEFSRIYPKASLGFSGTKMELETTGSRTSSYTIKCDTSPITVSTEGDFSDFDNLTGDIAKFEGGILLPLPLLPNTTKNTVNANFYINVNGADVLLVAEDLQVPEFLPGYKYGFYTVLKGNENSGAIDLYLSIEPWQTISWNSGMGAETEDDKILIKVGGFEGISWQNIMGAETDDDFGVFTVGGFTNIPWSINMGGTNDDGTNN